MLSWAECLIHLVTHACPASIPLADVLFERVHCNLNYLTQAKLVGHRELTQACVEAGGDMKRQRYAVSSRAQTLVSSFLVSLTIAQRHNKRPYFRGLHGLLRLPF